jgi:hypothetical protein
MPEQATIERARKDKREGKSPSDQAGEFVREEFHHSREGKHGARSTKQAIAIGLSKARRAGVKLPPPSRGQSPKVRRQAERDYEKGQHGNGHVLRRRSRARLTPPRAVKLLRNVPTPREKQHVREGRAKKIYDKKT